MVQIFGKAKHKSTNRIKTHNFVCSSDWLTIFDQLMRGRERWHWFIKGNAAARFAAFPTSSGHLTFLPRISTGFPEGFLLDFHKDFHEGSLQDPCRNVRCSLSLLQRQPIFFHKGFPQKCSQYFHKDFPKDFHNDFCKISTGILHVYSLSLLYWSPST